MPSSAPCLTPLVLSFTLLVGCSSMGNPPENLMKHVPLIDIGKPEPADKNYILYIPGGKSIPLQPAVKGPFVVNPGETTTRIQLTRSLYPYKEWFNLDGRNWIRQAYQGHVSIGLAPQGGIAEVFVSRPD